jgi:hypothetical protein
MRHLTTRNVMMTHAACLVCVAGEEDSGIAEKPQVQGGTDRRNGLLGEWRTAHCCPSFQCWPSSEAMSTGSLKDSLCYYKQGQF